ncbi:apolipoprotein B-100-like isoform X2 [Alosa sapidissima]|uniref:apolipoprotein B-100-like isoform X1 n=1 Tax=Alosa sapidissima TaxID=34773 RepID=UPI001C09D83B|nr:apolipoprotein B-100-like isoform X1 [Alosa sapidissima]XP_041950314.1 apolipoprotein B-100-like isoform X2 [Alosa sapidissima]
MGDTKLCLVLLLSAVALAHADNGAPCLMAKRYKPFHKYEYLYEAESLNFLNGAVNGPKGSCKVEIEVPGPCHYIVRTTECTLSEVADFDAAGEPVFVPAATTDAFKAAMEKNPLKVTVEGDNDIKLFPEDDEPINILNIKRGIISGFAVPVLEEEKNKRMPTIYGLCKTDYTVNAREDIATDVTLTRDLSRCDQFRPVRDHTSPLALITGMHYPLAQLIKSTQTCNYKFDNAEHHPVFGECLENHILVPFSHRSKQGVTNVSKQKATLLGVTEFNDRVFDPILANEQTLHPHGSVDKSPIQDKDAALAVLRELAGLSKTDNGHKRAHLAHRIVSMVRKMSAETLAAGVPEALEISRSLTYQALFQCGTPECSGAIMQILRTFDSSSMEIDATVYAMGLMPNPSRQLVHDMLEMAKFKQSKPIFYGASNAVKRLYQAEGKVTPEIEAVANFALEQIGDCTGDQEHIFMSLKVIGNMAAAMGAASPALKSAVIQCVNQPAATPEVQLAAIQAYRQTTLPEEGREVLMQVLLDGAAPLQKRVAAYLVLMKDPQPSELSQLAAALPIEENQQAKSFVISHVTNILSSTAPETQELRQKILDALQGNEVGTVMDPTKFSRNYKVGSVEGNMIFEGVSYLPKEVMLEMTLNAFGFDVDMFEIGMEGKGLEPTIEALFGANGFFPDTVMKTIYYAADKMPVQVRQTLRNMLPSLRNDRKKRQASQSLIKQLGQNINKLFRDLKAQDAPEAMVYLRLLGMELGYLKTKDMEEMAYSAALMIDNLLKMFPADFIKGLLTSADNELFAHYIFMDNEFYLPTGPGVPLRVALSGTFTPGVKGGLQLSPDMSEVAFMPSAGIEFVTEVGAHLPDFVQSGLEMHTNIYHESGLKAKVSVSNSNIKLTIPAPQGPAKLVSLTNSLVSVHGAETKTIPSLGERVDVTECTPVFAGMKYCTALQYSDAMFYVDAPYFPFTGDSKLAIELHPTGEISEYTADIDYSYEEKTDKVVLTLKAEGAAATEATATLKFNRQKYTVEADLQIPDYDLEVGLRLGSVEPNTKGKATHSVQIDLINKNIPQASLIALGKLEGMKDANVEVQLLVPPIADFKVSAHLHREEDLTLELKTDFGLPETKSVQEITLKYDDEKLEVEVKSDMSTGIKDLLVHVGFEDIDSLLNEEFGQSGMTVGTFISKSVEGVNAYIETYCADIPFVQNIRVPEFPELSIPEKLYLKAEADAKYNFGKHYYTIAIPLPLGGKSSGDLNFPAALTTPHLTVPQLGLEVASIDIPLPEVFIPEHVSVSMPVFGKAEVSAKVHSNLYNLEADVSAGRDPVDHPSYSANVEVTGTCPAEILSMKIDGSALLAAAPGESLKAEIKTHMNHKLIDVSITVEEIATIADKFNLKSNSKIEATSPLGVQVYLDYNGDAGLNTEEISGNGNLEASLKVGPISGSATISQTVAVFPFKPEAKIDSSMKIDSTLVKAQNTFAAAFANGELSATSNTAANDDTLVHNAEVTIKDSTLAVKSDTKADALGLKIQNVAEASAGAGAVNIKMETSADHTENRIHSLVTAILDINGLAVNSDADVKLAENTAIHKASLTLNKDGLATNGATSLQSPLKLENTFSGTVDASKVDLNIDIKGEFADMKIANAMSLTGTPASIAFKTNAEAFVMEGTSYTHSIALDVHDYTASLNINNDLKVLHANLENHAELKAEAYKADLTGSLKAAYGEQELKHTYEIKYADLTANAKCSTTGMLLGSHLSQNTEVLVPGLAIKISNDARFNSQVLRFDTTTRATAVPFSFNLDAIANADGDLTMYGKHSVQVYSKFLMKAEPLAVTHSHECRISTSQNLDNGVSIETGLDNKFETLLTPSEQKAHLIVKSKFNNHAMNEEVSVYNTPERLGLEMSGNIMTNLLNIDDSENQEFGVSGFVKYDKNNDVHVIYLPFTESLVSIADNLRLTLVEMVEAMQAYIRQEDLINKLESLPQYISDFVKDLNVEERTTELKQQLLSLSQEYTITFEDLEASLMNLRAILEGLLSDLAARVNETVKIIKELIVSGTLSEDVVKRLAELLNTLNEEFDINAMLVAVIEAVEDLIKQIDMMKLKDSSIALLHDLDAQYAIKAKLEERVGELKQMISSFSLVQFAEDLKSLISSIDIEGLTSQLVAQIPTEQINKIVDTVKSLVTELDITGKLNAVYSNVRTVLVKYELDKKIEAILEKVVELIQKFKIDETVQVVADTLKTIHIPVSLEDAINYLKTTEIKQAIEHLNEYLDAFVQSVKSFDYNAFVDYANEKIAAYTAELNTRFASLEIPQKVEAAREFVNYALSTLSGLLEELRGIKAADVVKSLKDIIDTVALNDIRALVAKLPEVDLRGDIEHYLQVVSNLYTKVMDVVIDTFSGVVDAIQKFAADQAIIGQFKQIIEGVATGLKTAELEFPSLSVPLTDLVLPSFKISLANLQDTLPTQIDLPEFTILGFHTVPAMTITYDDIKQKVMQLIDFIVNYEITFMDVDAFFGELSMNYLPDLSAISLPEISLPEISLPAIPKINPEDLINIPLTIPEIKLPHIPTELMVPAFGKLYGEIKVNTPIYNIRTTAEFQNSTDSETTPQFTAFLNSKGSSPAVEVLGYNLDCTARVAIPKRSRIIIAETLKFTQQQLSVEHQASMTVYGLSAQASAKTALKINTSPYTADLVNNAFFAMEGGITSSFDTSYNHKINLPIISYTSDMSFTQKTVARQDGTSITVSLKSEGSNKVFLSDFSEELTQKADLDYTMNLRTAKLTYTSDTDSPSLKMKESMNAEAVIFSHITFDARVESESPYIKNSLITASGKAHLGDMKIEIKANHDTELAGSLSGTLSNSIHVLVKPIEVVLDFQNKGNAKASLDDTFSAKLDLQNDYSVTLNSNVQHINTMALLKLNHYRVSYNFTVENNQAETGIYASVDGDINLDFLTVLLSDISIPEITVPFTDFRTPAIYDINLYEHTGLKHLLTSSEQTVDADAKIVYKKSRFSPLFDLGLIYIPAIGNLVTEASFKSSIINLNVNAEVSGEDDVVIRIGANSASVFESLTAKLDGTSSLTTRRDLKLATALSLENAHIEATHDSTLNLDSEELIASFSAATVAKVNLPIFTAEANHQLKVDPRNTAFAENTFKMVYTLNLPVINVVGSGDVESNTKFESTFLDMSIESTTKEQFDGTILGSGLVKRSLNDVAYFYCDFDAIRSTRKTTGNAHVSYGDLKIEFDVDEDLAFELKEKLYASMKFDSNNEINVASLNTKGKHSVKTIFDVTQTSVAVDMEADLAQPSTLGDLSYFEKLTLDWTNEKEKESYTLKIVTPVYTTTAAIETEGSFPKYKGTFKASAKSPAVFLEYDLDGSITAALENGAVSHTLKAVLTHADLTMDVQHAIEHQDDGPAHTLNVDVTSPTFTDANFRYAARKDGASTSISSPSTGFLGLQLQGKIPQMSAKLYCRYASNPENDVDILVLKAALTEPEMLHLHASANMEAPNVMLSGLQERVPAITSSLTKFAYMNGIDKAVWSFTDMLGSIVNEAYYTGKSYTPEMSQMSIFFRNFVVQYQKTVQTLLDVAVMYLRETQIELPGMEKATLLEIANKITTNVGTVLEQLLQVISDNLQAYLTPIVGNIQGTFPDGVVLTGGQVLDKVKAVLSQMVEMVKNLESLDVILEKLGEALREAVETAQAFIDSMSSDILDIIFVYINGLYSNLVTLTKNVTVQVRTNLLTAEEIGNSVKYALESVVSFRTEIINFVTQLLPETGALRVNGGILDVEFDIPVRL